jgi:hypothetical protein
MKELNFEISSQLVLSKLKQLDESFLLYAQRDGERRLPSFDIAILHIELIRNSPSDKLSQI